MGFFNIFGKSNEQKVIDKLNANNLGTMVSLLTQAKMVGSYSSFSQEEVKKECDMLKEKHSLKKGPANESLNRFKWAKDICEEYDFSNGAVLMQRYVNVYNMYLKDYCD